jgi:hypothetical protein
LRSAIHRLRHTEAQRHRGSSGPFFLCAVILLLAGVVVCAGAAQDRDDGRALPTRANIPYADASPILRALRAEVLPEELRGKTATDLEAAWPAWVARRDAAIRARVEEGEADSIVYFLQFGTTFTKQPRITEHELAGIVVRQAGGGASRFLPSPVLQARIEDLLTALTSADTSERVQFARKVIARRGFDPATERGRTELRTYLLERVAAIGQAPRRARLLDSTGNPVDQMTLFRDRGLAPDTSIAVQFGVEQALAEAKGRGLLQPGGVRRVAIVGPGLDFVDKQEGYDFYPPQTIQPFAVIDALIRLGLADATDLRLTAFDLSPGILEHLDAARGRARDGRPYSVVLVRDLERAWTPELERYWARLGDRIGEPATAAAPPANTGRVDVRAVSIRPSIALSIVPRDLNVVLQRLEPASAGDRFDLIVATNILIYYDVFEQSLAAANIAHMLRPGGLFLSNDRIVELPDSPLPSSGSTTTTYLKTPGIGDSGDRVEWFRRR